MQKAKPDGTTPRAEGVAPAAKPPAGSDIDAPHAWLGSTALLDLEDPRLRMRANSLTQFSLNDHAKALAVYAFVKRLPFHRPFKLGPRTAREVLDSGRGDGPDKATLMIALLRLAGVPARIRIVRLDGKVLRGLVADLRWICWPFVEVWLDGRWIRTDTYIFDAPYMAAARHALRKSGQDFGFGVYVNTQPLWTAREHAALSPLPVDADPMVLEDMGPFHDPDHYMGSHGFRALHWRLARFMRWNLMVPKMRLAVLRLRGSS